MNVICKIKYFKKKFNFKLTMPDLVYYKTYLRPVLSTSYSTLALVDSERHGLALCHGTLFILMFQEAWMECSRIFKSGYQNYLPYNKYNTSQLRAEKWFMFHFAGKLIINDCDIYLPPIRARWHFTFLQGSVSIWARYTQQHRYIKCKKWGWSISLWYCTIWQIFYMFLKNLWAGGIPCLWHHLVYIDNI